MRKETSFEIADEIVGVDFEGTEIPANFIPFNSQKIGTFFFERQITFPPSFALCEYSHFGIKVGLTNGNMEVLEAQQNNFKKRLYIQDNKHVGHVCFGNDLMPIYLFPDPLVFLLGLMHFLKGKALFFHSFGGFWKQNGFLFIGPSGVGKTTLSNRFQQLGVDVVCDERAIVRLDQHGFTLYSSPWPGDLQYTLAKKGSLTQIFLLRKQGKHLEKPTPSEFLEWVLPETYHMPWDKAYTEFVMRMLSDLYAKLPVRWADRTKIGDPSEMVGI